MSFLSNIGPVLGRHTSPPIEIHRYRDLGVVIRPPEARHVISRLRRRERELPRSHQLRVMVIIPICRSHLYIYTVKNNIHPISTAVISNSKVPQAQTNWKKKITRTVTLCESGKGWASSGLTTLYLPTVMALLFMSSAMHFV